MKRTLARWVLDIWYKDAFLGILLLPFAYIFSDIVRVRRFLYCKGILGSQALPVPVIVVGNITVGGTGKTPLVIWLANLLIQQGYQPGIVSRGYGGTAKSWPCLVTNDSDVDQVGDEPVLIARQTACPVMVGPSRVESAQKLLAEFACDIILSDDGLQHYQLRRDIEIAVIDGERRFGNGYCLPAGPLREPVERLGSVDFVVVNGEKYADHEFAMCFVGEAAINLKTGEQKSLRTFQHFKSHALAGIGNPDRFFKMLETAGLSCTTHSFPDHFRYAAQDIYFEDGNPVLMTEKDAVKCSQFAGFNHWYVPINAELESTFRQQFLDLLINKTA